ncbi:hypothetical protein [Pilimelia columellifera]|uniref:Uncharacterized protein n=1 Tax=Pilimelia columellifera subsp. columellifera TaxID=706583 RepID=A0ABP6AY28_9ACTN
MTGPDRPQGPFQVNQPGHGDEPGQVNDPGWVFDAAAVGDVEETAAAAARARVDQQALWSVAVGLPAVISVLRLWVLAGGDLQTTLLLVANVGSINLVAALIVTATWLLTAALVAVFAVGQLTVAALDEHPEPRPWRLRFARIAAATPTPLKVVVFVFAALTWQTMYLPLLLLGACVALGLPPMRWFGWLAAGAGYLALAGPTLAQAVEQGELVPALLIVAPATLLPFGVATPVATPLAVPYARVGQLLTVALVAAATVPVLEAPVLPLSVLTIAEGDNAQPVSARGWVVEVNDATTALLHERGGVDFVPNATIVSRVLCPDSSQTPRYRLWAYGIHIEDSLLQGIGRNRRPSQALDSSCRSATGRPAALRSSPAGLSG